MSDIQWMETEAYELCDRFSAALDKAYKQGVGDAWRNVKALWENGTFTVDWSAEEMMRYAENNVKCREDVEKIADQIGIHALYAMVSEMRGENDARRTE